MNDQLAARQLFFGAGNTAKTAPSAPNQRLAKQLSKAREKRRIATATPVLAAICCGKGIKQAFKEREYGTIAILPLASVAAPLLFGGLVATSAVQAAGYLLKEGGLSAAKGLDDLLFEATPAQVNKSETTRQVIKSSMKEPLNTVMEKWFNP